jgi:hypothetical protein
LRPLDRRATTLAVRALRRCPPMWDARRRAAKPRWGWLYAMVTPLLAVLGLVEGGMAAWPARQVVELVLTLLIFGAMALWVRVNRVAMTAAAERPAPVVRRAPTVLYAADPAPAIAAVPTSPAVEAYLVAVNGSKARSPRGGAA